MRKFLITNLYNMYNMGEVLQLQALKENMPKDSFTIQGLYSFIDKELCRRMNIDYVGNARPQSIPRMALAIAKLTAKAVINGIYNNYDMVIDLGGDTFSDKPNIKYTMMHSLTLLPFAVARKPYVICSQSIGPFGLITRSLAKFVLKRASAITVREVASQEYLKGIGIESKLHPDLAHLCKAAPLPKTSALIGVNPSAIFYDRMKCSFDEYVDMIVDLVRELQHDEVILIPHVYGPKRGIGSISNADDREVMKHVVEKTWVRAGTHEDLSRCSLFIGFRMHACVRAISLGIPTIAIGYSHKMECLPKFAWVRTLDAKTFTLRDILNAVSELKNMKIDKTELGTFTAKAKGNIDTINEVHRKYTKTLLGSHIKCYVSHSTMFRRKAASGGVAKALAIASGREIVTLKPNGLKPSVALCDAEEMSQGSIYSFNVACLQEMRTLATDGTIAIGVPCQISTIKRLHPGTFCIGLFCSHRAEQEGMELLLKHCKLRGDKIEYRAKVNGDTGMLIDDKLFIPTSVYWKRFFNYAFISEQCLRCNDQTNEKADISLGDAWGIKKDANVIITRTEEGERLLQKALTDGTLTIEEISAQRIIDTQNYIGVKKGLRQPKFIVYKALRSVGNRLCRFKPLTNFWLSILLRKEASSE